MSFRQSGYVQIMANKKKCAPKQLSNSAAPLLSPLIGKSIPRFPAVVQFSLPET